MHVVLAAVGLPPRELASHLEKVRKLRYADSLGIRLSFRVQYLRITGLVKVETRMSAPIGNATLIAIAHNASLVCINT